MKRLIIDAKKLTPEILALIKEKYPDGYDDLNDVITFGNSKGEIVKAIEVKDDENTYLVKIGSYLNVELDNFEPIADEIKIKPIELDADGLDLSEEDDIDEMAEDLDENDN